MNWLVVGPIAALAAVIAALIVRDALAVRRMWRERHAGLDRLDRFC